MGWFTNTRRAGLDPPNAHWRVKTRPTELIRDENDLARYVDYIHINPVKHGHAAKAGEWPWSSIHRSVWSGMLTADWAADPDIPASIGERQALGFAESVHPNLRGLIHR